MELPKVRRNKNVTPSACVWTREFVVQRMIVIADRWAATECIEEAAGGVGVVKEVKQVECRRGSETRQSRFTAKS